MNSHIHLSVLLFVEIGAMIILWKYLLFMAALHLAASNNEGYRDWGAAISVIA
jgi:hypothetical protein